MSTTPTASAAAPPVRVAPPLLRRMACWVYEGLLLFGVYFAATALFSLFMPVRHNAALLPWLQGFLFVVCGGYFAWCWSHGHTLAMKTWRIALVGRDGMRVGLARAGWRYLLSWIWVLPPLALGRLWGLHPAPWGALVLAWVLLWALAARWHPERQFWHDHWAGTRLIDVKPARPQKG